MEKLHTGLLTRIDSIMTENLELKLENINLRVQLKQNPVRPVVYQSSFLPSEYSELEDRVDNLERYNCLIDSLTHENEELHDKLEVLKERITKLEDYSLKIVETIITNLKPEKLEEKPEKLEKPEKPEKPEKTRKAVKTGGSVQEAEERSISDIAKIFL